MSPRDLALHVLRAQAGDRDALETLFRAVQEPLFRCIRNIVREPELAEDVLQDVFVIVHREMGRLREPEFFRAWLYRIATREALRRLKRERRFVTVRDEDTLANVRDPKVADPQRRAVALRLPQLVANVSPASRAVLVLHYIEEFTLPEVADVLGISIGTVKSRLAYGLHRLRHELGVEKGEDDV